MKNIYSVVNFLEGAISLIPQQTIRFLVYFLLTVGVIQGFKLVGKEVKIFR